MPNSFAIPIVFYYPGGDLKGVSDKLVQQIDIMPTVLNYLEYDKPYFSFGFDALAPDRNNFVVSNIGNIYNFFMGDYFMTYGDKEVKSVYNLKTDKLLEHDLKGKEPQVQDSLMRHLQSFMQQYNNRMIHNKLVAD